MPCWARITPAARTRAPATCCCAWPARSASTSSAPARVLDSDEFAAEVRERERFWQERGINGVPAVVIDGRHLISGGQPPEVFEQALRQIAAGA